MEIKLIKAVDISDNIKKNLDKIEKSNYQIKRNIFNFKLDMNQQLSNYFAKNQLNERKI